MKKIIFIFLATSLIISCVNEIEETPIYNVTFSAAQGGSVSNLGGQYELNHNISVTAIPDGEYMFKKWSDENTNTLRNFKVTSDINLEAFFEKRKYPLIINIEGEGKVLEEIMTAKTTDYDIGTRVKLTAVATGEWYVFDSWGDIDTANVSSNSVELVITEPTTLNVKFKESNIIVKENITRIDIPGQSTEYLRASFYNVSGPFHYNSDGGNYMFYPGTATGWSQNNSLSKDDIESSPSHALKRVNGKWEYFKTFEDVRFWGARNFEIIDNKIVMGDGNEIGDDMTDWDGDTYYGEILGEGDIKWTKVNDNSNMGYYHGSTIGDLNGDGLLDVGGAPGQWYPDLNEWRIKIFTQNNDGSFNNIDNVLDFDSGEIPFTLDFADVFGDSKDEIIFADYGNGDTSSNGNLNQIQIFAYNNSTNKFELHWKSSSPSAFYSVGWGATSIKVYDFDNDGIKDIAVAREGHGSAFEVWKGEGDGTFTPNYSKNFIDNEMQFREFLLMDVNTDGFMDIILRPFHYGSLYRNNPVWWDVYANNGIKLNHLIWINNGDGTFQNYNTEELKIEGMLVDNVHPYMENGILHFVGSFTTDEGNLYGQDAIDLTTYDIKVNLK
ncbi:MAG: VCBS repeat-containing protein [Polaribacter sp.]|nr:VCBS repeat-containing protein [Polaribacter sp.]MDG1810922.1 VCBS repeat-containing protein [Polaribacter sp.]MDG1994037.1 VCBS repeat-containing protein [Polaribacter sp.]